VISVVIAVRDGMPWLEEQLTALSAQQCASEWEVVVCDNGSTDSSAEAVRGWESRSGTPGEIRLVDGSARRGPAAARNIGAASARGELLAFCDADDVVQPGWLDAMRRSLLETDVVAGSFEMGSLNGEPRGIPQPAQTKQLGQIPAGLAANLAVRRSAFDQVGGFDEALRVGEDIDLCWRLQLAGFSFSLQPDAVVAKRERSTDKEIFRQGLSHGRSGPRLYKKHRDAGIRRDFKATIRSWIWLLVKTPRLYDPKLRRRWLRVAGVRIGRLLGSLENGVFSP